MPRFRIILLATLATLVSFGFLAGLAWRWLARDALARAACKNLSIREVLRFGPNDGWAILAGPAALGLATSGLLVAPFLFPSPFGIESWVGPGVSVVFVASILVLALAIAVGLYRSLPSLLEGEASFEPRRAAWLRAVGAHVSCSVVVASPAVAVGVALAFVWPGLTLLRVAVFFTAIAPVAGAVLALRPALAAHGATWVPLPAPARRGRITMPRWLAPVGLVALAFVWGVVGARIWSTATRRPVFLPPDEAARLDRGQPHATPPVPVWKVQLRPGDAAAQSLDCNDDIIDWTPAGDGALGWCGGWDPVAHRDRTTFFRTSDRDFADGRLPPITGRLSAGGAGTVAAAPWGVAVVESWGGRGQIVRIVADRNGGLGREGTWVVRTGGDHRAVPDIIAAEPGGDLLLGFWGSGLDRWIRLDWRTLEPARPSALELVLVRFGAPWLIALGVAGLLALLAVAGVGRAGRLARHLRWRSAIENETERSGAGLWSGRLSRVDGSTAILETPRGDRITVATGGARVLGWAEDAPEGPAVVVGSLRKPLVAGGAYRAGMPEVRGGFPFVVLGGDLLDATTLARDLRARALGRALALLWTVSVVPFLVIVLQS